MDFELVRFQGNFKAEKFVLKLSSCDNDELGDIVGTTWQNIKLFSAKWFLDWFTAECCTD
jgi:hypothetical protein